MLLELVDDSSVLAYSTSLTMRSVQLAATSIAEPTRRRVSPLELVPIREHSGCGRLSHADKPPTITDVGWAR